MGVLHLSRSGADAIDVRLQVPPQHRRGRRLRFQLGSAYCRAPQCCEQRPRMADWVLQSIPRHTQYPGSNLWTARPLTYACYCRREHCAMASC